MRKPHSSIVALATLSVIADVVAFRMSLVEGQARWERYLLESLLFSQTGMLWIWVCVGTLRASVRVSSAMIATVAMVGVASFGRGDQSWLVSATAVSIAGGIVVMLGVPRLRGWWLVPQGRMTPVMNRRRFQFSLRSAMELLTALAVALMLYRTIYSEPREPYYVTHALPWFAILGLGSALVAGIAFPVVFDSGRAWVRWSALILVTAAAWYFTGGMRASVEMFGVIIDARHANSIPFQAALTTGSLLIVRGCGYRLVRSTQPVNTG